MFQCVELNGSTARGVWHTSLKSSLDVAPAFALSLNDVRNSRGHDAADVQKRGTVKLVMVDGVPADQEIDTLASQTFYVVFKW